MKWFSLLTISSLFAQSTLTNDALSALQQIRTVIPERQWVQEFSILVDEAAFECAAERLIDRKGRGCNYPPELVIGRPIYSYLNATMAGETIRILDWYQEFEEGVFWRTPTMMDRLTYFEEE